MNPAVRRVSAVGALVLLLSGLLVLLPSGATAYDATALAQTANPPDACVSLASGGPADTGLVAFQGSDYEYDAPAGTTSVSGSASVQAYPTWYLALINGTPGTLSDPTISIASTLDPSVFDGMLPGDSQTFPASCMLSTLAPDTTMSVAPPQGGVLEAPGLQVPVTPGFDSSWSVDPSTVPVGGGTVTVHVTAEVTNAAILGDPNTGGGGVLTVNIPDIGGNPGVTLVSLSPKSDPSQGIYTCTALPCPAGQAPSTWDLKNVQADRPYEFTAVVHVDNPPSQASGQTALAWAWSPFVGVGVASSVTNAPTCSGACTGPGSAVTIPVAGLGSVTYSIADSGQSWSTGVQPSGGVVYSPTPYPPPLPSGVSASALGAPTSATTHTDTATGLTDPAKGVGAHTSVPANALPTETAVSEYPLKRTRALAASIPEGHAYLVGFAISWITKNGGRPAARSPITMKITDREIKAGDVIYHVVAKRLVRLGAAKKNGSATLTFRKGSTFVVSARSKPKRR